MPENARTSAKRAFIVGPDDVRVAMVETGFAGVTTELDVTVLTADALGPYDAPRTPWGEPDIQGIWTSSSAAAIPFERPIDADTGELTPEEALARHEGRLLGGIWGYEREWRDITLGYDGAAVSTQVAMVVEPADGRVPALTSEGEERVAALEAERVRRASVPAAGPEERSPYDRCIARGLIPLPSGYNNGLQIVQGPGHVAITREMIHETRVIPTEPRPAVGPAVTAWQGHSQGRWEGDTLVVETTNFNGRVPFRGSSDSLTLVERYTRIDADTLEYRFTVDDPAVWTEPWTGMFRWRRDDSQYELVEYACHEGNYGMSNRRRSRSSLMAPGA